MREKFSFKANGHKNRTFFYSWNLRFCLECLDKFVAIALFMMNDLQQKFIIWEQSLRWARPKTFQKSIAQIHQRNKERHTLPSHRQHRRSIRCATQALGQTIQQHHYDTKARLCITILHSSSYRALHVMILFILTKRRPSRNGGPRRQDAKTRFKNLVAKWDKQWEINRKRRKLQKINFMKSSLKNY